MQKILSMSCLLVLAIHLAACSIELRDPNEKKNVRIYSLQDMELTEPMYFVEGRFMTQTAFEYAQKDPSFNLSAPDDTETEFTINNLTIRHGGILFTMGKDLTLHIQNLKSEQGVIASFPDNSVAPFAKPGRSGGKIYIEVENAEGPLRLRMMGEKGGEGLPGREADAALMGKRLGQPGAEGGILCSKSKQGYPGQQGMKGGDSGTAEIKVAHEDNFQLAVELLPGQGGVGGHGGGPGGLEKFCPGPYGPVGNTGPKGIDGVKQAVQLHQQGKMSQLFLN